MYKSLRSNSQLFYFTTEKVVFTPLLRALNICCYLHRRNSFRSGERKISLTQNKSRLREGFTKQFERQDKQCTAFIFLTTVQPSTLW